MTMPIRRSRRITRVVNGSAASRVKSVRCECACCTVPEHASRLGTRRSGWPACVWSRPRHPSSPTGRSQTPLEVIDQIEEVPGLEQPITLARANPIEHARFNKLLDGESSRLINRSCQGGRPCDVQHRFRWELGDELVDGRPAALDACARAPTLLELTYLLRERRGLLPGRPRGLRERCHPSVECFGRERAIGRKSVDVGLLVGRQYQAYGRDIPWCQSASS